MRNLLFKFFFGVDLKDFKKRDEAIPPSVGLSDVFLFDFKNFSSQYNENTSSAVMLTNMAPNKPDSSLTKIQVKPIDVLQELETIPTPFTLALLEDKIEMLKIKEKLITQFYAKREVQALIERLQNRKVYSSHRVFFDAFQNTTDEKIQLLLEKYDLVMRTSDIFVPEFPNEAITIMENYTKNMQLVCNKNPVFYVIATPDNFKQADKKRDPILLAQSPFGFYWQILGAWDKEMILLSEL